MVFYGTPVAKVCGTCGFIAIYTKCKAEIDTRGGSSDVSEARPSYGTAIVVLVSVATNPGYVGDTERAEEGDAKAEKGADTVCALVAGHALHIVDDKIS